MTRDPGIDKIFCVVDEFPQGCEAFRAISPNVELEESGMRDDAGMQDVQYTTVSTSLQYTMGSTSFQYTTASTSLQYIMGNTSLQYITVSTSLQYTMASTSLQYTIVSTS